MTANYDKHLFKSDCIDFMHEKLTDITSAYEGSDCNMFETEWQAADLHTV